MSGSHTQHGLSTIDFMVIVICLLLTTAISFWGYPGPENVSMTDWGLVVLKRWGIFTLVVCGLAILAGVTAGILSDREDKEKE